MIVSCHVPAGSLHIVISQPHGWASSSWFSFSFNPGTVASPIFQLLFFLDLNKLPWPLCDIGRIPHQATAPAYSEPRGSSSGQNQGLPTVPAQRQLGRFAFEASVWATY